MKKSPLQARRKVVWTTVIPFLQKTEKSVVRFCSVSEQTHTNHLRHFLAFFTQQRYLCTVSF